MYTPEEFMNGCKRTMRMGFKFGFLQSGIFFLYICFFFIRIVLNWRLGTKLNESNNTKGWSKRKKKEIPTDHSHAIISNIQ